MRIVFFYPSKILGGAELLFYRVAKELNASGRTVAYVDYSDGFVANRLKEDGLGIEVIKYDNTSINEFTAEDVLILPANFARVISNLYVSSTKCRLIFWVIHPENLVPKLPIKNFLFEASLLYRFSSFFLLSKERKKVRQIVNICYENRGIFFMDGACYQKHKQTLGDIGKPSILPIFVPNNDEKETHHNCNRSIKTLRVAWLGRIDKSFKHFILEKLIRDLNLLEEKNAIELNIIGKGEGLEYIRDVVGECDNIVANFIPFIDPNKLQSFLSQNVDLLFAMGTSALEGAKAGIAVVCLDASYQKVTFEYRYRFLYESEALSLGYIVNKNWLPKENQFSLQELIRIVREDYQSHAVKTFDFYKNGYEPSVVINDFVRAAENTKLRLACFPIKLFRPSTLVRIWRAFRK